MGYLNPHLIRGSTGPTRVPNPNAITIGLAVVAQLTAECSYTLQWGAPSALKIVPFHDGIWTPFITWFLSPPSL